jgi:predicted GIY-YIG superfamily endonuclease
LIIGRRKRVSNYNAVVHGFAIAVTDRGFKSWILHRRLSPKAQPARLKIGTVGIMTLATARDMARKWNDLISQGKDPRIVERIERLKQDAQRQPVTETKSRLTFTINEICVYHLYDSGAKLLYVGVTTNFIKRQSVHLAGKWGKEIATITLDRFDNMGDAVKAEYDAISKERPKHNQMHREKDIPPPLSKKERFKVVSERIKDTPPPEPPPPEPPAPTPEVCRRSSKSIAGY